jgi:NCS1 family nucleobase:cation symporter-1
LSQDDGLGDESLQGALPATAEDRVYGFLDYLGLQTMFGFGAWAFLVGSLTGLSVGAFDSITTALLGNALGLYPGALCAILFARYGVDQFLLTDAPWGHQGSKWQVWAFFIPTNLGWIAYCSYLMGQSFRRLLPIIWPGAPDILMTQWPGTTILAAIAIVIGTYVAYRGPIWMKWFTRLSVPLMLVIILWFMYVTIGEIGIGNLFSMAPPDGGLYDTYRMNWMNALEFNVALGFAWAYYWGAWARLGKSENAAHHGPWWGWGPILCIAVVFSAFAALITGLYDPTAWFAEFADIMGIAPELVTILALTLYGLANTGAVALLTYTGAISQKVVKPTLKWKHAALTVPLLAIFLANPWVFDTFSTLLTIAAAFWAPYSAILVADYAMRWKYGFFSAAHIRDMYENGPCFEYHRGHNLAAWIVLITMVLLYFGIYNPVAGTVGFLGWGFPTIPGLLTIFAVSLVAYPVLFKLIYPDHYEQFYDVDRGEDVTRATGNDD